MCSSDLLGYRYVHALDLPAQARIWGLREAALGLSMAMKDDAKSLSFVEDTAVVFDEIGIITRPGAESRRAEITGVEEILKHHRLLGHITEPGTLDGGDVLVAGRSVFVGSSTRTNNAGIDQALAAKGILVAALDFRQPPEAGYPASICDVNLAVRWLKAHAAEFNGTSAVGAFGNSSGRRPSSRAQCPAAAARSVFVAGAAQSS